MRKETQAQLDGLSLVERRKLHEAQKQWGRKGPAVLVVGIMHNAIKVSTMMTPDEVADIFPALDLKAIANPVIVRTNGWLVLCSMPRLEGTDP